MTDRQPDAHPDSKPRDDDRGSVESIDQASPDAGRGEPGGTEGTVRDEDAQ